MFTNRKEPHTVSDEASAMIHENGSTGTQSYGSTENGEDSDEMNLDAFPITRTLIGPVANLCSATLGAGVLALPYALQQAGILWGGVLMLVGAASTLYSLQLLVEACRFYDTYTYEGIVQLALGKKARTVTEVSILLFCGGCAVAYIITVGDIVESLSLDRNAAMVIVWSIAMLPLSLLRTMRSLQSASGVGIFSIFLLIIVANIHYWRDRFHHSTQIMSWSTLLWPAHGMTSVLMACPLIIFAFSCQPNVCAIYHELPEKRHMPRVLLVAVSVCAMLYTSISLAAYLDFGKTVQPNVLQNYCVSFPLIQLAFVGMSVAVVMAFPLNVFPTRVTLEGLIWGHHHHSMEVEMEDTSSVELSHSVQEPLLAESYYEDTDTAMMDVSTTRHVVVTLAITILALALAMVAPNISVVFGLLGGTTSSVIGFILPGMVGIKVLPPKQHWKARILVVGGVVIGLLTTAVTVYSTFDASTGGSAHHNPCNGTMTNE